ncbi:MAG: arginine--tRNA ligase [Erysipelotrichaceae bacterium]|nr:arginine--tRNA ligase [Erysipelotrichaceae bacterium]
MDIPSNIKSEISRIIKQMGVLDDISFVVEIPKDSSNGDYASNVAMQLTKILRKNPRLIAQDIVDNFNKEICGIEKIEIAGPGFINFFVSSSSFSSLISKVIEKQDEYGKQNYGQGKKYDVEFVSANPTGDLHLGHAWQAALGDSICNLLENVGYDVTREYYVNDAGVQILKLSQSIYARYQQELGLDVAFPEDGYHGADIIAFAKQLKEKYQDSLLDQPLSYFRKIGIEHELEKIVNDLSYFRVKFDVFSHEVMLYEKGWVDEIIPELEKKGYIYYQDNATWFKTTMFGDDKDRVVKKSDGTYTYFLPDIAYHRYKLQRGFDYLVNILGADHHGYIHRMEAAVCALGYQKDQIQYVIHQMVRLIKDGEELKLSKRTGKAYTLRDLCDEIGVNAARYQFASKNPGSHMEIDIDLAVKQSNENPVYYVQYAHARCCSIIKAYEKLSISDDTSGTMLTNSKEIALLKHIGEFEHVLLDAALSKAPYKLTNYLYTLASLFHTFYNECKVIDQENLPLTAQRVVLAKMTRIVIKNGLKLIGVQALNEM